jgi:predicted MPP superfamily phosphohydrolase
LGTAALGGLTFGYAYGIEPMQIEMAAVELLLPRLAAKFSGYKVVQLSDIHLDNIQMDSARLAGIVAQINRLTPDLIVITGDFISTSHHGTAEISADELVRPLRQLDATDGVFGVLGNHDHSEAPVMVQGALQAAGIIELRNDVHMLQRADAALHIAGVDDVLAEQADIDRVLAKLPEKGTVILLAHEPDFADAAAETGRFDLQLSGHSHGGQIAAPLFGPIILPTYGKKYPQGLYQVQDMLLYTNKGVGTIPPRVRFNCPPEITMFTLVAG